MQGVFQAMTTLVQNPQTFWVKFSQSWQRNYNCVRKNPGLFWMRLGARFEFIRSCVHFLSKLSNKSYEIDKDKPSAFKDINVDEANSSMEKDGYALGINLPPEVVREILDYAYSTACYADRNPGQAFYYQQKEQAEAKLGRQFRLGSYFSAENCPAIKKLERDPALLELSAKFLGAAPIHMATELWWSFPVAGTRMEQLKAAQVFHYDMDDYRFIKFFFYLTDVDVSSGPHAIIRGTHKNKKFSHQLLGVRCASKDDKEIVDCYGAESVVTICGPAGTGFAEDTYCFHKGSVPTEKVRLLLQIEFAINEYGDIRSF
jgi:hypothetical protein